MKCCFCGQETNGKQFWDTNLITKKREKFDVCNDCTEDDLEIDDKKD